MRWRGCAARARREPGRRAAVASSRKCGWLAGELAGARAVRRPAPGGHPDARSRRRRHSPRSTRSRPTGDVLVEALRALSERARELTVGGAIPLLEVDAPPADSGILGPVNAPDALTVTIGFGASLFDDRYGLAARRPRELVQMPTFPDRRPRPRAEPRRRAAADLRPPARHRHAHARELLRTVRGTLQLRWTIDGFSGAPRGARRRTTALATCSPSATAPPTRRPSDAELMNELVWAGAGRARAGPPAAPTRSCASSACTSSSGTASASTSSRT